MHIATRVQIVAGGPEHCDRGPVTVVRVDAHIDWRDEIDGERYGYRSPMRRISEMPCVERLVQVGMRGVCARADDVRAARSWESHFVRSAEVHHLGLRPVLDLIPPGARCFVTIDCDGLDPSIMPVIIAPAPGGLTEFTSHRTSSRHRGQSEHRRHRPSWNSCPCKIRSDMLRSRWRESRATPYRLFCEPGRTFFLAGNGARARARSSRRTS